MIKYGDICPTAKASSSLKTLKCGHQTLLLFIVYHKRKKFFKSVGNLNLLELRKLSFNKFHAYWTKRLLAFNKCIRLNSTMFCWLV